MAMITKTAGESVEKRQLSYTYTLGGNINLYDALENRMGFL